MRRGVARRRIPGCLQRPINHRCDRSFTVAARDVNRPEGTLGMSQRLDYRPHVVEAELDPELLETIEKADRIAAHARDQATTGVWVPSGAVGSRSFDAGAVVDRAPMNRSAPATVAFISRRSTTRSIMPFSRRNSLR